MGKLIIWNLIGTSQKCMRIYTELKRRFDSIYKAAFHVFDDASKFIKALESYYVGIPTFNSNKRNLFLKAS